MRSPADKATAGHRREPMCKPSGARRLSDFKATAGCCHHHGHAGWPEHAGSKGYAGAPPPGVDRPLGPKKGVNAGVRTGGVGTYMRLAQSAAARGRAPAQRMPGNVVREAYGNYVWDPLRETPRGPARNV